MSQALQEPYEGSSHKKRRHHECDPSLFQEETSTRVRRRLCLVRQSRGRCRLNAERDVLADLITGPACADGEASDTSSIASCHGESQSTECSARQTSAKTDSVTAYSTVSHRGIEFHCLTWMHCDGSDLRHVMHQSQSPRYHRSVTRYIEIRP